MINSEKFHQAGRGIVVILLLFGCMACMEDERLAKSNALPQAGSEPQQVKVVSDTVFDPERWSIKQDQDYPYRDEMLHDLMNNQGLRTLKKAEIIALLGEPDRINEGHLYYKIDQLRLGGLWPLHTKTMVIQLADDGSVNWVKIHE